MSSSAGSSVMQTDREKDAHFFLLDPFYHLASRDENSFADDEDDSPPRHPYAYPTSSSSSSAMFNGRASPQSEPGCSTWRDTFGTEHDVEFRPFSAFTRHQQLRQQHQQRASRPTYARHRYARSESAASTFGFGRNGHGHGNQRQARQRSPSPVTERPFSRLAHSPPPPSAFRPHASPYAQSPARSTPALMGYCRSPMSTPPTSPPLSTYDLRLAPPPSPPTKSARKAARQELDPKFHEAIRVHEREEAAARSSKRTGWFKSVSREELSIIPAPLSDILSDDDGIQLNSPLEDYEEVENRRQSSSPTAQYMRQQIASLTLRVDLAVFRAKRKFRRSVGLQST